MKLEVCIVLVMGLFLLSACSLESDSAQNDTENGTSEIKGEDTASKTNVTEIATEEDSNNTSAAVAIPVGGCSPEWVCISSKYKAYRTKECTFIDKRECTLGCLDGQCKAGQTCEPGFKCVNKDIKGFQTAACQWINKAACEWGCLEGDCLPKPNETNTTTSTETQTTPPPAKPTVYSLTFGQTVTVGEEEYNVSIYNLEQDQVRVVVNKVKSDWIAEGEATLVGGITIHVTSIFFQSYAGGNQAIEFTVE